MAYLNELHQSQKFFFSYHQSQCCIPCHVLCLHACPTNALSISHGWPLRQSRRKKHTQQPLSDPGNGPWSPHSVHLSLHVVLTITVALHEISHGHHKLLATQPYFNSLLRITTKIIIILLYWPRGENLLRNPAVSANQWLVEWWRHDMEMLSVLVSLCEVCCFHCSWPNSLVDGKFRWHDVPVMSLQWVNSPRCY